MTADAATDRCDPAGSAGEGSGRLRWADRVAGLVASRESQIVLGLDPDPRRLWPGSATGDGDVGSAVLAHCVALIDAAGEACVAVKPQLACFERLGAAGATALAGVVEHAHGAGLLVIADGKRGDVPVTASVYAEALTSLGADAFTANPLLGIDALVPLVATGAGVFVLVRTSNPGARDVQDLELADGGPLWHRLARIVDELGRPASPGGVDRGSGSVEPASRGGVDPGSGGAWPVSPGGVDRVAGRVEPAGRGRVELVEAAGRPAGCGLADVGAVLGATEPGHLARARELMPRAIFLLPGVGAQGGRVEDLAPAFAPGRAGGLVSASRSISGAHEAAGGGPADSARAAAHRLRALAWSL